MKTKLSIIIPVSSLVPESVPARLEAIQAAIKHFYKNIEVIIVEQSLDGRYCFLPFLKNVTKIELRNPVFNKSWCCNVGVKASTNGYVVIAESDMFSRDVIWERLLNWMIENNHKWAFAWSRLIMTNFDQRKRILAGASMPGLSHITPKRGYAEGGLVCFKKSFYNKIGMMNECLVELGGIDNEIVRRCMQLSNFSYPMFQAQIYHLKHPQRKKSSRPTRRKNIIKLRKTNKQTPKAIEWLVKQDQGNRVCPLSDRIEEYLG